MRARKLLVPTLLAAASLIPSSMPASARGGACPPTASGFSAWDVATEPYQVDDAADANGNGLVCSRPTPLTFTEEGQTYPVYVFIDDRVPV